MDTIHDGRIVAAILAASRGSRGQRSQHHDRNTHRGVATTTANRRLPAGTIHVLRRDENGGRTESFCVLPGGERVVT